MSVFKLFLVVDGCAHENFRKLGATKVPFLLFKAIEYHAFPNFFRQKFSTFLRTRIRLKNNLF
jgi:hypothetical protein